MQERTRARLLALSVLVGLAMLAASIALRPLWRDEYWSLYFSAPHLPLDAAVTQRMMRDVHPPFYFILGHAWLQLSDSGVWARVFNVVALGAGAAIVWALGRKRPQETGLFLALCATSYWVIYFGTEARMYALVFAACAVTVFALRAALEANTPAALTGALAIFAIAGAIASASHYFGALWTSAAGFALGLTFLVSGRWGAFVATGFASVLAIAPTLAWILHANPQSKPGAVSVPQTFAEAFSYAANQFLRGLVVKTFGSNLPAFIAAFLAVPVLARQRDRSDAALLCAVILSVVIAFAIHLFALPALIKERAFIVIMPAVIWLAVRALSALAPEQKRARALAAFVPAAAIVSPFLFIPEYFKDREQIGEVREAIANAGDCAGQPVLTYFRPSEQAQDFHALMIGAALKGAARGGGDLVLVDAARSPAPVYQPRCRVRALALVLGKGDGPLHQMARATLTQAGAPLNRWQEVRLGRGRSLVWIEPEGAGNP